jgi:hypothetical protein
LSFVQLTLVAYPGGEVSVGEVSGGGELLLGVLLLSKAITLASSIAALLGLLKREKIRTAVKEKNYNNTMCN